MTPRQIKNKFLTIDIIIPSMITFFLGIAGTAWVNSQTNANKLNLLTQTVANLTVAIDEMNHKRDTQDDRINANTNRITTLETEFSFYKPQK